MIVSIYTRKGGTAKTTSAISLGTILASQGKKTLLVDLDSQLNLSSHFLVQTPAEDTSAAFLSGELPIVPANLMLDLAPASLNLAAVDYALLNRPDRFHNFAEALASVRNKYDIIIMDLAPAMNQVSIAALAATDFLLSPVLPDVDSISGLQLVEQACMRAGKDVGVDGIFLAMFNPRRNLDKTVELALRKRYGDKVFAATVRQSVKIREAHRYQTSITEYAPHCAASADYTRLAVELVTRLQNHKTINL